MLDSIWVLKQDHIGKCTSARGFDTFWHFKQEGLTLGYGSGDGKESWLVQNKISWENRQGWVVGENRLYCTISTQKVQVRKGPQKQPSRLDNERTSSNGNNRNAAWMLGTTIKKAAYETKQIIARSTCSTKYRSQSLQQSFQAQKSHHQNRISEFNSAS